MYEIVLKKLEYVLFVVLSFYLFLGILLYLKNQKEIKKITRKSKKWPEKARRIKNSSIELQKRLKESKHGKKKPEEIQGGSHLSVACSPIQIFRPTHMQQLLLLFPS